MRSGKEAALMVGSSRYWVAPARAEALAWHFTHSHSEAEIGLITGGSCRVQVGRHCARLTPGSAYFLPSGCKHGFEVDSPSGLHIAVVHFDCVQPELTAALLPMSLSRAPTLPAGDRDRFVDICVSLRQEMLAARPFARFQCDALISELAVLVLRASDPADRAGGPESGRAGIRAGVLPGARYARELTAALNYMHEHLNEEIRVAELARTAAVSASQLRRLFRLHLGSSPQTYLLNLRIATCKSLLAETDHDLLHIADAAGFGTAHQLARCFRRAVGCSPSKWRAARRGA